jgi:hypothetical protein
MGRYHPCFVEGVRLSPLTRSALVLIPLLLCAGRLHAQRARSPEGVTQEVNRCLTLVRVATSRRKGERDRTGVERPGAANVRTDAAGLLAPAAALQKTA